MKFKLVAGLLVVISLLLLLLTLPCYAADSVTINLKMLPMSIQDNSFYITQVIDGRIEKNDIGSVQVGLFNKKVPEYLANDFTMSIQSYVNNCFVVDNKKTPILIIIDELKISESEGIGEFARAKAKIEFYKTSNGKVGKLFETEATVEKRSFLDVTEYHEENIRNVIEKCFVSFINSNWNEIEVVWEDQSKINEMIVNNQKLSMLEKSSQSNEFNNFSIAGGSFSNRYNIKFEWNINNNITAYADYYKRYENEDDTSFNTTIIGMEYFFSHSENNMGLYVGAGLPLCKDLDYDPSTIQSVRNSYKKADDLDYDLRMGYKFKLLSEERFIPWFEFGYSNIEIVYCNFGLSF
jgi:hypothetical protein